MSLASNLAIVLHKIGLDIRELKNKPSGGAVPIRIEEKFNVQDNTQVLFSEELELTETGEIEFDGTGSLTEVQ